MKFKVLLLLTFLLSFSSIQAQNEAAIWYFGFNAGLDFNSGAPVALTNGMLSTNEGCSTISNSNGQLLFYTDGIRVWDKSHNVMPNGTGLFGNPSSTQSGIIVPKPNNPNLYYIFTVDDEAGPNGLRYSEVDLTLNGGNGDVNANKNILLTTPTAEKISAIEHTNGNDIWVITHEWNSNNFFAYLVTPAGVNTTPITSTVGAFHGGGNTSNAIGNLKFSPNGERLALAQAYEPNFVEVFDFDTATGLVSNPIFINGIFTENGSDGPYGVEFSPDSNTLYVSDANYSGTVEEVFLLFYPYFFTPNNDTVNDFWQIKFSEAEPDLKILIFDRYGKLLTPLDPRSRGWDGTFNGKLMPTSDYWFLVKRPSNGKEYRGHFTLRR